MKNIGGAFARSVARAYCGENSLVSSRGRKLDFVREDVPNVRSPDLLFLYLSRATSPKTPLLRLSFQPSPHCVFFLPPFAAVTLLPHLLPPPFRSLFFLHLQFVLFLVPGFQFPPGHSTTSRRSSTFRGTMHISPIFMEFLLDSFLPPLPSLFSLFIYLTLFLSLLFFSHFLSLSFFFLFSISSLSLSLSFSFSHSFYFRFKRRFSRSVAPRYHRLSSLLLVVTQRVLHSSRSRRSSPPGAGFCTEISRLTPLNCRSIKRNNIPADVYEFQRSSENLVVYVRR